MAIQSGTEDVDGLRTGPSWTDALTGSDLGTGIFDIRWDLRPRLRRWLAAHELPTAVSRGPHLPIVEAWALLDGGVIAVASVTLGSQQPSSLLLSPGMRVVGFRAFRLLIAELALPGPAAALAGEPASDPDRLRAEFEGRVIDAAGREQAELLASCTDRPSVRWVSAVLGTGPPPR